jgi:hypothetical protein
MICGADTAISHICILPPNREVQAAVPPLRRHVCLMVDAAAPECFVDGREYRAPSPSCPARSLAMAGVHSHPSTGCRRQSPHQRTGAGASARRGPFHTAKLPPSRPMRFCRHNPPLTTRVVIPILRPAEGRVRRPARTRTLQPAGPDLQPAGDPQVCEEQRPGARRGHRDDGAASRPTGSLDRRPARRESHQFAMGG